MGFLAVLALLALAGGIEEIARTLIGYREPKTWVDQYHEYNQRKRNLK